MGTEPETQGDALGWYGSHRWCCPPASDTSALEREIDQQVYALYGLTPDEIAIVEGSET